MRNELKQSKAILRSKFLQMMMRRMRRRMIDKFLII